MSILKSKIKNGVQIIPFIIASLLMSIVIISCGGCKGAKVVTQASSNPQNEHSSDNNEKKDLQNSQTIKQYPYTENNTIYINDTTKIIGGIKIVTTRNTSKLVFPNGKVLYNDSNDMPILKNLPNSNYDYGYSQGKKNFGFYDFSNISIDKKRKLFSNMNGYNPNKVKEINKARFSCQIYGLHELDERIYRVLSMKIFQEDKDSDRQLSVIGNIGFLEIYNRNGDLLYEIKLDKFGGDNLCITPDNKHIVLNTIGDEGSDYYMVSKGATTIWSYENPKLLDIVYHIENSYGTRSFECFNNHILFQSNLNNTDSIFAMNILLDKKTVSTLSYHRTKIANYKIVHDGSFIFEDGTKYNKGSSGFSQYIIEDWNEYVENSSKEKDK